jgi:hypothetical protein
MVETFMNVDGEPSILKVEVDGGKKLDAALIPPFLKVLREVTDDQEYETYNMAKTDYRMPAGDLKAIKTSLKDDSHKKDSK